MSILIPWVAVFAVCLALSVIGMRLQRNEKDRKRRMDEWRRQTYSASALAAAAMEPSAQTHPGGINRVREPQGASRASQRGIN